MIVIRRDKARYSILEFTVAILVAWTLLTLHSAVTSAPAAGGAAGGGGGGGGASLTASSAWDERNLGKGQAAARTPAVSSSSVRGMASDDDDGEDDDPGCCAVMCTTPAVCCLPCRDASSPRERDLLMAMMEGLTHHIMDKHSPDQTASTWAASNKWLTNRAWEGNSHVGNRPAQATYYYDWARSVVAVGGGGSAPGHVCEIGMNGGHSALIFLAATTGFGGVDGGGAGRGGAKLTMFDLSLFDYSATAKKYIETLYPGRFVSHDGDSHVTLPKWTSGLGNERSDNRCDVFSIDGDHSHGGALTDIRNAAAATKRGGKVILDDMDPGGETRRAFDDAVDEKILGDPKCVEDVLIRVGYDDRSSVANARSMMVSWCSATVL